MADQGRSLPVTPKLTEAVVRNSRRNSMPKASSPMSGEKNLPHYLRASTGSCHDFCKFGGKHAFEEKTRHPFPKRIMKKPYDDQNSAEFLHEKMSMVKSSPNSKTHAPNTPESIKQETLTKSFDSRTPLFSKLLAEKKTLAGVLLTRSFDSQSAVFTEVLAKKKTSGQDKLTGSVDSQSSMSSDIWAEKKKMSVQGKKNTSSLKLRTSPDSKSHLSPNVIEQNMPSSSKKVEVSLKKASSKAKEVNLSAKHVRTAKLKPSSPVASRVSSGGRSSDIKIGKKTETSKLAIKKVQVSPRASLSFKTSASGAARGPASVRASVPSKPSLSRVASLNAKKCGGAKATSSLNNQNKIKNADSPSKIKNTDQDQPTNEVNERHNDVVQEKTLYVIKMETENNYFESDHNEKISVESSPPPLSSPKFPTLPKSPSSSSHNEEVEEESEYSMTEAEDDPLSEEDESEYTEEEETLDGAQKGRHRKARMVPSEDKDVQPVKLHFRRGKVIDIQSESTGPRRLKFRRGRMFGENQNCKPNAQKSFKRRGADVNTNDSKPDSEKVLLRHQDVHGKKDAQGLFNNVIEETATKLAETRKSKVKALVGAFETVISLQDKPSANIVS